jgi:hypothetical protein
LFALTMAARLGIITYSVLFYTISVCDGSGKIKPSLPGSQIVEPTFSLEVGLCILTREILEREVSHA